MRLIVFVLLILAVPDAGAISRAAVDVRLGVPGRANAAPSIAARGQRVAVAWGAREAGGKADVFVAVSDDGGLTFRAPVRANDDPGTARVGGEMPPRVILSDAVVHVLWTSRGSATSIRVARSEDGGRTFGASRELQQRGAAGDRGWPSLAVDAGGQLHAIWLDHRGLVEPAGSGARPQSAMPAGETRDPVAMAQKSALFYANGAGEREIARGVCYCCKTALAGAADGSLVAAWRHVYPGSVRDIAFSISRDAGRTFSAPVRVSEDGWQLDGCPDDGPAVAVDDLGTAHIVWPTVVSTPEPHKAIFYASTRDGRTFSKRTRVSPEGRNAAHPQVSLHGMRPVVVWDEIDQGRRRLFSAMRTEAGSFSSPVALRTEAAASYPAVAGSGTRMLVAFTEGSAAESLIRVQALPGPN